MPDESQIPFHPTSLPSCLSVFHSIPGLMILEASPTNYYAQLHELTGDWVLVRPRPHFVPGVLPELETMAGAQGMLSKSWVTPSTFHMNWCFSRFISCIFSFHYNSSLITELFESVFKFPKLWDFPYILLLVSEVNAPWSETMISTIPVLCHSLSGLTNVA